MRTSRTGHELDRIENALQTRALDAGVFERCAQDLLSTVYPGLSPIPGGADSGRDADLRVPDSGVPVRVLISSARDVAGVRSNMLGGLRSMRAHHIAVERVVIVTAATLNEHARQRLRAAAAEAGVSVYDVFDSSFIASRLRRDGAWRRELLGLSGAPITVSAIPAEIAEAPWGRLSLRGRDEDLDVLRAARSDLILVGPPGTGKTRLLVELDDVLFVEQDPDRERLADDLRELQPARVVVDDAAAALDLLPFLLQLRRSDADLLDYSIIATCWRHDLELVADVLPYAAQQYLGDLERAHIDAVVIEMGVTGVTGRRAVIEQAEGRIGWAVTLAALLLRAGWTEVLTGRALLQQIGPFLRRIGVDDDTRRIAAVVAALGGVNVVDIARLAATVELTEAQTRSRLKQITRDGLLETIPAFDGRSPQTWILRPVMVGHALAADVFFAADVPLISIDRLLTDWPEYRGEIGRSICIAAASGAPAAREHADTLAAELLSGPSNAAVRASFLGLYAELDPSAAHRIVNAVQQDLSRDLSARLFLGVEVAQLCKIAVEHHVDRTAARVLIELAGQADGLHPLDPTRPVRALIDLCQRVLPDRPIDSSIRIMIGEVLTDWLPRSPTEQQWSLWGLIAAAVLDPHVSGAYEHPGDHEQIGLLEGLLAPPDLERLRSTIWPAVLSRLLDAPDSSIEAVVRTVEEWIRIGRGLDHPYGRDHPQDQIDACADGGKALLDSLAAALMPRTGWARRLARISRRFDLPVAAGLPVDDDPFFRDLSGSGDADVAERALHDDIARVVRGWSDDSVHDVVARLVHLRTATRIAGTAWPDRVEIACQYVAAGQAGSARSWVAKALRQGLFPEAAPFVAEWARTEPLRGEDDLVQAMLEAPEARPVALHHLLAGSDAAAAVPLLADEDLRIVTTLALTGSTPPGSDHLILTHPSGRVRSTYALNLVARLPARLTGDPAVSLTEWVGALSDLELEQLAPEEAHRLGQAVEFLQHTAPELLSPLLPDLVARTPLVDLGRHLMQGLATPLRALPRGLRTTIVLTRPTGPDRAAVVGALTGTDTDWIAELLDAGDLDPASALAAAARVSPLDITTWARMLVPRGVDPHEVASLVRRGSFTGSRAEHLASLTEQMDVLARDSDPIVAAVGRDGAALFATEHADAKEEERRRRIRR